MGTSGKRFAAWGRFAGWLAALGLIQAALPAQGPAELEEECRLAPVYETPHTPWARPYAGGRLRVLFFLNIGYCGTLPREVVELGQRFDLETEAVFWARIIDSTQYHWHGDAAGLERMARLVAEPWDCFVFVNLPLEQVPLEQQYRIVLAVTNGSGLILAGAEDPRVLKPERQLSELPPLLADGVPLASLPFVAGGVLKGVPAGERTDALAASRMVAAYRVRNGRGVRLPARPELSGDDPSWQTQYEYWQSLFGRAILWAAGREPRAALVVRPAKASFDRAELPAAEAVTISWQGAAAAEEFTLAASLRRLDGVQTALPAPPAAGAEGRLALALPRLRAGQYFVDVRATSKAGAEAWASAAVAVTSPLRVAAVTLEESFAEPGGALSGSAAVEGLPAAGETVLQVNLRDRWDRVLARQEFPAAETVRFRFAVEDWMPMLVRVEGRLLAGGEEVSSGEALFRVTHRHRGQFNFLVWDIPSGTLAPYAEESLRRLGMTLHLAHGSPPAYVAAGNVAWVPYTTHIGKACQPACWNDEQAIAAYVEKVVGPCAAARRSGVFVYSLGDEVITRGACTGPACLAAYRQYLRDEYKDIAALNASWGTTWAGFDEVELSAPDDNQEAAARRAGNYPRWYDRQAFQSYNFARLCARFVDRFRELDPQARVGFEGAGSFEAGDDYDLIVRTNGFWAPYPGLGDEIIRSIAPRDFPRANWMGYTKDADSLLGKYWRMITRGCDSVWWWRWDGVGVFHGLLAPHLGPYQAAEELARDTQIVRDGLGTLLLRSEMLDDGIAVLYSMPSAYACQVGAGPSFGRYASAHQAWSRLIREAGLQYRYVTDRMLRQGEFQADRYKALVLARAEAMGPAEASAIRDFAERGGTVLADLRPALYDGHCKPLPRGALDDLFGIEREGSPEAAAEKAALSAAPGGEALSLEWDKAGSDPGVRAADGQARGRCGTAPIVVVRKVGKGQAILLNFAADRFPAPGSDAAPEAAGEFVRRLFAAAGVRPAVRVQRADGRPAANLEVVRWRTGRTDLVALSRESGRREEVALALPEARHVYDLRRRRYLGPGTAASAEVIPCRATFFALTPERAAAPEVRLPAPAAERGRVVRLALAVPGADGTRAVLVRVWRPDGSEAEPFRQVAMVGPEGAEVPLPFAYNDPEGAWRVTAAELFTGETVAATLDVR